MDDYKILIQLFEHITSFKGIDANRNTTLDLFDHLPQFDDRLFEIWLIKQSAELIAQRLNVDASDIQYTPLYKTKKKPGSPVVSISTTTYRIDIVFQNRTKLIDQNQLKWYWNDSGGKKYVSAIPDLIFFKYPKGQSDPSRIVLVDAKNRSWRIPTDNNKIKPELVQQIYIQSNFSDIFQDRYHSMLIAHNVHEYQERKCRHVDHGSEYEIEVISLDIREEKTTDSLTKYVNDLCTYLDI